jgi:hypothetical protein
MSLVNRRSRNGSRPEREVRMARAHRPGKGQTEKEAHGEFESEHPGYCGAQDTFYVANLKGVVAFISKPSSIPTARSPAPSSTIVRHRSRPPISSKTACCRS